jgi:hypothetical protein
MRPTVDEVDTYYVSRAHDFESLDGLFILILIHLGSRPYLGGHRLPRLGLIPLLLLKYVRFTRCSMFTDT